VQDRPAPTATLPAPNNHVDSAGTCSTYAHRHGQPSQHSRSTAIIATQRCYPATYLTVTLACNFHRAALESSPPTLSATAIRTNHIMAAPKLTVTVTAQTACDLCQPGNLHHSPAPADCCFRTPCQVDATVYIAPANHAHAHTHTHPHRNIIIHRQHNPYPGGALLHAGGLPVSNRARRRPTILQRGPSKPGWPSGWSPWLRVSAP